MTLSKLVSGAALASLIAVAAHAHSGATGVVKERMDGMGVMKDSMKVLAPMMQGKTAYDAAAVRREAKKIGTHAGDVLTALFPKGSNGHPSEAKAEIWTDWEGFVDLAERLQTYSDGLASAAENGLMMSKAQGTGMMSNSTMMGSSHMGSGSMMGGGMVAGGAMMGGSPGAEALSQMPADGVFMMLSQTCSACHTRFREE
ncbi:cytochrome c [Leisingera sp. M658]|uniref:c-type cytochrome n=1 Tax=Leisingera sp. M658 TaxID=2867015 RepID=UPI0021A85457|nr:cytochrome c [Leisingera sp. M658]UWQ77422.1 cytochrome c [Leisingera sp. M658]